MRISHRFFAAAKKETFSEKVIKAEKKGDLYRFSFEKECDTHLCDGPQNYSDISKEGLLNLYEKMYECRRVETAADQMYKSRLIRGFLHLYNGQEAIAYGMEMGIKPEDAVITAYRDHGNFLARGGDLKALVCELIGKAGGSSEGKGGSMHLYDRKHNFFGGNGIVGAQCPVGTGLAFAFKYQKKKNVSFVLYGDGAANQGQLYESFNMSMLWKLPVVFCCENNHYGMGTSVERASATLQWYTRGDYVPGLRVDGMDALAVKEACEYAATWGREGKGPMVLEFETYRYVGHSLSDPGTAYRTREEVETVRARRDPIERVKARILSNEIASEQEVKTIEKEVRARVDQAVKEAKDAPWPKDETRFTDIYAKPTLTRGRTFHEWSE